MTEIIGAYGGYRRTLSFGFTCLIYHATEIFCQRNYSYQNDALGKTVGQMIGAARSARQNIVEGSMAGSISKETEIKLTGVARASLEELLEDYRDYLRVHNLSLWEKDSTPAMAIRRLAHAENESYETYRPYLESRGGGSCANIMICLINQCTYLLRLQLEKLTEEFISQGGIRERMTQARIKYRDERE